MTIQDFYTKTLTRDVVFGLDFLVGESMLKMEKRLSVKGMDIKDSSLFHLGIG